VTAIERDERLRGEPRRADDQRVVTGGPALEPRGQAARRHADRVDQRHPGDDQRRRNDQDEKPGRTTLFANGCSDRGTDG
jgi:hypothetical protein